MVAGTTGDQAEAGPGGDGSPGLPRLAIQPGPAAGILPLSAQAPMSVQIVSRGGTVTVVLRGELDVATAPGLRARLVRLLDSEPDQLIVELAGLTFTDCAGARAITGAGWRPPGSVKPVLRHAQPAVRRVLELTGLGELCCLEPD